MPTRIGDVSMTGIFDTGSQVSIISQRAAEAAGLPWTKGKNSKIRLVAINGDTTTCIGKVTNARLLLTNQEVPVYGDLYVNPGKGFNLIIGRSIATRNKIGIREEDDGTYLSFESRGDVHEFNASPVNHNRKGGPPKRFRNERIFRDREANRKHRVCVAAATESEMQRIEAEDSDAEEKLNSSMQTEISTQTLEDSELDFGYSPEPYGDENPSLVELPPKSDEDVSLSESENKLNEAAPETQPNEAAHTTESDDDGPQQPGHTGQHQKFEIEARLHENYIRFVQKGTSNDEWNTFCEAETNRLKRQKEKWRLFNEDTDDDEEDSDGNWSSLHKKFRTPDGMEPDDRFPTPAPPDPGPTTFVKRKPNRNHWGQNYIYPEDTW